MTLQEMPHYKIGITGASGMLGSYLIPYLQKHVPGCSLRCLARNIPPHATIQDVEWMPGDLHSEADCREFIDDIDVIIHLAQANSPASSDRHWPGDHAANGLLTLNLLHALRERKAPPAHFVYASSGGSIYGAWHGHPFSEDDPCLPLSPYGIQKLTTEHYLRLAVEQGWLSASSLRISNAYGALLPPEKRQGLIGVAMERIKQGLPVRVFGSLETVRDYVHLQDVAHAFALAARPTSAFSVFNIGSGTGYSVAAILKILEEITGKEVKTTTSDFGKHAFSLSSQVVLNLEKAKEILHWIPRVSLEAGIRQMWQFATKQG